MPSHPLNYLNSLFYTSCPEAFTTSGLANFFVCVEPVQAAIHQHITTLFPKVPLRLKEICCGSRPDRWLTISALHTSPVWRVVLSDFSPASLPQLSQLPPNSALHFSPEILDLFHPLRFLSSSARFQVILTTYGFDTLWFPQDVHYTKTPAGWTKSQLSFPPLPPRFPSPDSRPDILSSLRFSSTQLSSFVPQTTHIPVDMALEPFGQQIASYYRRFPRLSTNFPGGLVAKIQEFFSNQLTPHGIFLSGDLAFSSTQTAPNLPAYQTSGQVAKFQTQDYGLAAHILKSQGFSVQIISLSDLLEKYHLSLPLDLSDHLFLQVSRYSK